MKMSRPRASGGLSVRGLLAIAIVVVLAVEFRTPAMTAEPQRVSVDVASVIAKSIRQWDAFNGRVTAVESVEIRPRVSGYIDSIAYREGEEVRRGDLLFNIDPRPYRAAVDSAKARLERARASVLLAKLRDQRAKKLLPNNTISQDEAQSRHAVYLQSQADVLDAEASLALAELNLQFTQVRAPVDGRAGRAMLTVGNLAIADQSLLTTVVSQDLVYVDFDPDEQSYLRYNAKARKAAANGLPVRIALANEEGYPSAGTVYFVDNQVNSTTGTIRMRARVDNAQRKFTPGLFARVELANVDEVQAVLIDEKAVLTDQDRKYVYVLAADSTAQRKDVQLGRSAEGLRIITSGLSAGDKVIIGGLQRIYASGTPVEASEIPMFVTSKVGTL